MGIFPEDLKIENPDRNTQPELEQMAMAALHDNAVIITFDGRNMGPVPGNVHGQFHIQDDGVLSGGASWVVPKIVFTNPEVTQMLGRVSAAQMGKDREADINSVLQTIRSNPAALAPPPPPVVAAAPAPAVAPASPASGAPITVASSPAYPSSEPTDAGSNFTGPAEIMITLLHQPLFLVVVALCALAGLVYVWPSRN
jgi:hypothetical protein